MSLQKKSIKNEIIKNVGYKNTSKYINSIYLNNGQSRKNIVIQSKLNTNPNFKKTSNFTYKDPGYNAYSVAQLLYYKHPMEFTNNIII